MGHIVNEKEEVYRALAERLNKCPEGAPINEDLMEILYRLYTESEAMVGSKFPMVPMTLDQIAGITGLQAAVLVNTLETMADKGLVIDIPRRNVTYYTLTPMVIGFFEFTFMRIKEDRNLKEMAELFDKYFQNPEVGMEFVRSDTKLFQTLVYESLIPLVVETEVLNYERASEIIRQSGGGALSMCACRHKASHLGKKCEVNAPLEVCTSLGEAAEWVVRRGMGKSATVDELLRVLDETEKLGLVHLGDNVLNKPAYICHCCSCCCGPLRAAREYGVFMTHPSNFMPVLDQESCTGCGLCADKCPIKAIDMGGDGSGVQIPRINQQKCIGCGVCAPACPTGSLTMSRRSVLHVPPADKMEQLMRMAREKGKL
jgi:NAD-dependent dihydropyrimidine dehydrogenase PreA subunit